MNIKNNRRRRQSKERIEKAFIESLQTKELHQITVSDICKACQLNRSTFYANYEDIYDLADIYCAWQNRYNPQDHSVAISLDFFEKEGKVYTRSSEHFFEHAYSVEKLTEMLKKSGFDRVEVFGDLSFDAPKPEEQRIIFAAHITNSQNGVFKDDIAP